MKTGKVYLIGAGPGDEELVTLKAVRIMAKCDVLLYDRLSNDSILKYAKPDAQVYYCGKRPGSHYRTQDEINEMLVKYAKEGYTVGRIKGGDPYVFGRGGEEALRLLEEKIEFEVVPGITSSIAVLEYAGIPMTQRNMGQSFHVFTGMTAEKLEIDWKTVSKLKGTLVFMMGLGRLPQIAESLLSSGYNSKTPAAVVMKGTTSKQRTVVSTLESISDKVIEAGLESPCIIAIGEVVSLSDQLDWYSRKPLFGKNIGITRSKAQSKEIREKLLDLGAEVTEINSIETEKIPNALNSYTEKLSEYDYIVLSSVNAVNYFFDSLMEMEYDIRKLKAEFPAIGPKTAEALKSRGIIPAFSADHFVMESLVERLKGRVSAGEKLFYPKSECSRSILSEELSKEGISVEETVLYRVVKGSQKGYESLEEVDIILFTSPSTVRNTVEMFGREALKDKQLVAIGPITEKAIVDQGLESVVSESYTVESMVKLIKNI